MPGHVRHLYLHIPFCRSRCSYCDFASEAYGPHKRAGRASRYVERLQEELAVRGEVLNESLSTAYLGGGTPTVLPAELLLPLAKAVACRLGMQGELTVEANPGCLDARLLDSLDEAGVTRLSLGIQSFERAQREALGRRVSDREVREAIHAVKVTGWQEWNLDLVFGIPGQDRNGLRADLEQAVAAAPPHISLYDLTYTPTYEAFLSHRFGQDSPLVAGDFAEEAYSEAVDFLEKAGYRRYEISNFSLPGHESRHNLGYWRGEDYLGLGASAVSTVAGERLTNPAAVKDYLAGKPAEVELLSPEVSLFERVMLGLRTAEGVPESQARGVLDSRDWARAVALGLAGVRCGKLFLTRRGLDVSNAVLAEVLVVPGGRASFAEV